MPEENINQEFRLKKIDEIMNYLIEEENQNKLMRSIKQFEGFWILYWPLTYSNFYNYWVRFHFCLCFLSWYSNRNCKRFTKTNCKKQIKKSLELKYLSRKKVINCMWNGNDAIIRLIVGSIKKT